jgi:DNA (cytosine-5)-methyltransferase 1
MLTYLAIADKYRPKWLLWENVPGVLSSNGGRDFGSLIGGLAKLGYGFAYRVLDAQYFGVPQRRKRVFVVGCLGDWRSAAKVLFEPESLCRDIKPSRQEGQEVANCLAASPSSHSSFNPARSEGNAVVWPAKIACTLNAQFGTKQGLENQHINGGAPLFVPGYVKDTEMIARGVSAIDLKDISKTLTASYGMGGADLDIKPLVLEPKAYNITFCDANGTRKDRPNGGLYVNETDVSNTLTRAGVGTSAVQNMRVRRLTPMECERLQGFPDNYTKTPTSSDTTRYKALGNSMAVPVMRWIGERINSLS